MSRAKTNPLHDRRCIFTLDMKTMRRCKRNKARGQCWCKQHGAMMAKACKEIVALIGARTVPL